MLYSRQTLRREHHLPQTFLVKFVGESSRRFSPKYSAHRDHVILLGHVLVNSVVGEASQRKMSSREEDLDYIPSREFLNALEDVAGLFLG